MALWVAISTVDEKAVQVYATHKAYLCLYDQFGRTPLTYAVQKGNLNIIKTLIRAGCNVNDADLPNKITALHAAAAKGTADILTYILQCGGDVHAQDYEDLTPLDYAISKKNLERVRQLVSAGSQVSSEQALRGDGQLREFLLHTHQEQTHTESVHDSTKPNKQQRDAIWRAEECKLTSIRDALNQSVSQEAGATDPVVGQRRRMRSQQLRQQLLNETRASMQRKFIQVNHSVFCYELDLHTQKPEDAVEIVKDHIKVFEATCTDVLKRAVMLHVITGRGNNSRVRLQSPLKDAVLKHFKVNKLHCTEDPKSNGGAFCLRLPQSK